MAYRFQFLNDEGRVVETAEHPSCADDFTAEQIALVLLAKLNRHPAVEIWDDQRKVARRNLTNSAKSGTIEPAQVARSASR
jgi:hypothetical protein